MKTLTGWMLPLLCSTTVAFGMNDRALEDIVEQRVAGDRSGVCVAVARVDNEVATAFVCADPQRSRPIDGAARFEIGSLSKAVQGVLVARLVAKNTLDLDLPLAEVLDAAVPQYGDEPICLRHLLTHTSGLPRVPEGMPMGDPANPYADLTPDQVLAALADVELTAAPGEHWEYSNFGAMLLSLALARHTGEDLDVLLQRELLEPLAMNNTAIGGPVITGHDATGKAVPAWDFATNLAGVGGLRSSLDDLVRFMLAGLGRGPDEIVSAMARSFEELSRAGGQAMGWGWLRLPVNDQIVLAHDGGTYGFSAFMAIDPRRDAAAVVLSDTSMLNQGSLGDLALHLIDPAVPLGEPQPPRVAQEPPVDLDLADYIGDYPLYDGDQQFMDNFVLVVFEKDHLLHVQGTGGGMEQPAFPVEPDGADRFFHPGLGLDLEFIRNDEGQVTRLDFQQGGLSLDGRRQ